MRNLFKKICVLTAAATLTVSAAGFSACGYTFEPLADNPSADAAVSSQGGFVVQKGEYVYFINGVEAYTSDNTYGTPVKGALMRAKMADVKAGENKAETVIPSLMVAADYTSGIFIYGDRIYYATPNNVGNTAGTVDNTYLDFKSVSLDGSDVRDYFRISDNAAIYRFVEAEGTVYVVYEMDDTLTSYNTADGTSTDLARSVTAYTVNSTDRTDPYIYYTMDVTDKADSDGPVAQKYNQIYRVRADATEVPEGYEFTWDQEWLDENNDGEAPYHNLGEIVLDGISEVDKLTQFNHDVTEDNRTEWRYNYTLQSYTSDGLYFTRTVEPSPSDSAGTGGDLYFLDTDKVDGADWNSVTGNSVHTVRNGQTEEGALEVVANFNDTADASTSAYFYVEEDAENNVKHHYLYVSDGEIRRVDVVNDGKGTRKTFSKGGNMQEYLRVATGADDAVLVSLDRDSSETYDYVYYTCTTDNGLSIERAVYNGEPENYLNESFVGDQYKAYKPVRILQAEHASGWYNYEVIDGVVFYINAETFNSTAYTYVWTIDLAGENGLMDNAEIAAFNEDYDSVMGDEGYIASVGEDNSDLSTALRYFFYTGETQQFYDNIEEAVDYGKRETYLYSEEEQEAFAAFADGTSEDAIAELGENYLERSLLSHYTNLLGKMTEDDEEAYAEYWQTALARYTEDSDDGSQLPGWAWALIGVGIGLVVIGTGVAVFFLVRARRKGEGTERAELLAVDTTDDRDVDVYTRAEDVEEQLTPAEEAEAAEPVEEAAEPEAEQPAEETAEPAAEQPAGEQAAEPAAEQPAVEQAAEPAAEQPAEEQAAEPEAADGEENKE